MIWEKVFELGKNLISVKQRMQKFEEDQKELRDELKEWQRSNNSLREEVRDLALMVERIAHAMNRDRDHAESERKIHRLEIENRLLRMERGLPAGSTIDRGGEIDD